MIATKLKTTLLPSKVLQGMEVDGRPAYESHDNDPFFNIITEDKIIKAGWYFISYKLELKKGKVILPKVYFDFGDGYDEKYHWRLFYSNNEIFGLVKVPWSCYKIRLDLSESNIQFIPGQLVLKKVNKLHAALFLFPILHKLGEKHSDFLRKLILQGSIRKRKELLRSLYEGNYVALDYQQIPVQKPADQPAARPVEPISDLLKYSTLRPGNFSVFTKTRKQISEALQTTKTVINAVDIVIPVYNGYEYLEKLIPQIISNSDLPYTLYIIDDCSPDPKVAELLGGFQKKHNNIKVQRNEVNLGFTKTVNRLLKLCKSEVIVLLNSDIEVPKAWLSKLVAPMLVDKKIGTITPMSNAATICSFPNLGDNPLLEGADVDALNKPLSSTGIYYEEIPTGVGFCMVINRKLLDKVGPLNEEAFPRGYGEEVDLCFRGRKSGFKNLLNTGLFVYHKHGGSFESAEKQKLMSENQQKLERIHPDFTDVLQRYFRENTYIFFRLVYLLKLAQEEKRKLVLFLDHDLGGGTNQYSKNYRQQHPDDVFISGQYINPNRNDEKVILFTVEFRNYNLRFGVDDLNILFALLEQYNIVLDELVVNNMVSYHHSIRQAESIARYRQEHKTLLKILCHDFYYLCPNFLLFKDNAEFCHLPESPDVCNRCLTNLHYNIDPKLVPNDFTNLPEWRKSWKAFLSQGDEIVMFSESTKRLFLKLWPDIAPKVRVTPHQLVGFTKYTEPVVKIGILGSIHSVAKGARFVQELANYIAAQGLDNYKLVSFGNIHPHFDHELIEKTGAYNMENLHYRLLSHKIDVVLIPSVCSETFSFTTREAIETGIPTACFNFGGQYDQVKNYKKGIIINEIKPEAVINGIRAYFKGRVNGTV